MPPPCRAGRRQLGVGLAAAHVPNVDGDEVVGIGLGLVPGEQLVPAERCFRSLTAGTFGPCARRGPGRKLRACPRETGSPDLRETGPENISRCREAISMASVQNVVAAGIGEPAKRTNLPVWEGLKNSKLAARAWTAMRVWLGVMWIQAGSAKIWGAEAAGFLHNNGAGVAGFAAHGTPAYSWWGSFLHGVVVPNGGGLGVLIAVAEFSIGVALVAGVFS